jgi:RNA polymerase sigma factor (sigma-70 family)
MIDHISQVKRAGGNRVWDAERLRVSSHPTAGLPAEKLTFDAECKLIARFNRSKKTDFRAIDKLVLHNLREAVAYIRKVSNFELQEDEILSFSYENLRKQAVRFRTRFGVRFFAYSKRGLRGAMNRYWETRDVVKHSGAHVQWEMATWANDTPHGGPARTKRHPDITDPDATPDIEGQIDSGFAAIELRDRFKRMEKLMVALLNKREQAIITLFYIQGLNSVDISRLIGLSKGHVLQIRDSALRKLREAIVS